MAPIGPARKRSLLISLVAMAAVGCGGGERASGGLPNGSLTVRKTGIAVGGIAYDAKRDLIYVTGAAVRNVTIVTPATGVIAGTIPIKGNGGALSISSDDAKLYVTQGGFIQRIDVASKTVDESFYVNPLLETYPSAPINAVAVRVQPGNSSNVAVLISDSAGVQEPIWSVALFSSGTGGGVLASEFGIPVIYDTQYSTDGSTVYVALESGVEAFAVSTGGTSGWVVKWAEPMYSTTAEARGKLYLGPTAYSEQTNKSLGSFTVSTPTWLFGPETAADRGVAFTCSATGGNPTLSILNTDTFTTVSSYPLNGLPLVAGAGVGGLSVAGKRCALLLTNPKTQASTLAFIDAPL